MSTVYEISSPQNPRYKSWLKLLDAKGIKKQQEALLSGRNFIDEILTHHATHVGAILTDDPTKLVDLPLLEHSQTYVLAPSLFANLDIYGTKTPLLIIKAPPLPAWDENLQEGLTLFLPFQNPINLGTTIRTAAAFNASVVLLQEAASPYLPKSLRASGPAIFQTPVYEGPTLEDLAKNYAHLPLFALSPRGENVFSFTPPTTLGLVAGPEGPGLDAFWPAQKRLSIPMNAQVESLNAAIAVAIALASFHSSAQSLLR